MKKTVSKAGIVSPSIMLIFINYIELWCTASTANHVFRPFNLSSD
jgi:hypothetical protein